MTEPDLFEYPYSPGYRQTDTSYAAAQTVDAKTLQKLVVGALAQYGPMTADETAAKLVTSILSIRPRLSELKLDGRVVDTGQRRENTSGRRAVVWALVA